MRKRISEQNVFANFNLSNEYCKIENILSYDTIIRLNNHYLPCSLEQYIDRFYFLGWHLRGICTSIEQMRYNLGIATVDIFERNISENKVLDFLQYAINLICLVKKRLKVVIKLIYQTTLFLMP